MSRSSPELRPEDLARILPGGDTLAVVRKKVLLRLLANRELERLGLEVTPERLQEEALRFRVSYSLTSAAETHAWLGEVGLTAESFSVVMRDFAAIRMLERHYAREIDARVDHHVAVTSARDRVRALPWPDLGPGPEPRGGRS